MALNTRTVSAIAGAALALTVGISTAAGQTTPAPDQRPAAEGRRHGFRPGRAGGPGGPERFLMPLRQLDLTAEQRAQVKEVLQTARPSEDPAPFRKLMELRQSLRTAILADTPDQTQIDQLRAAIVEAETAALAKRVEVGLKIAQILTPEQREKARHARRGRTTH